MNTLHKLRALLTRKDKKFVLFLIVFSLFVSMIETIGISAILPFISVASDFSQIESKEYFHTVYQFFDFESSSNFVIAFGVALIFFYIFRSVINIIYFYMLNRFSQGRYHLLAFRLFQNYLGFSYKEFVNKNSSFLTKSIVNEAMNLTTTIQSILLMVSEIFVAVFLYVLMIYISWKITLVLTFILLLNGIFLTQTVSKKIKKQGIQRADYQKAFYEIISSSFGNFKFIKLLSNEEKVLDDFSHASYGYARVSMIARTLHHVPRLFLEAIGFSMIAFVVVFLVWKYQDDIANVIPVISMFVLALFRLMPSFNRIMSSYNSVLFHGKALDIVHNDLMFDSEVLGDEKIDFLHHISLQNITFAYDQTPIFEDLTFTMQKGEKIAFVGKSGEGKSTLVDIVMGLYQLREGSVYIDDTILDDSNVKQWRKKIGYIPQHVYLFDGSVADNIVFGREYDEERIIASLKKAHVFDYLQTQSGLETRVGEGGIKLSGGQKQRIAIARALYDDPELLVLDEATSALDEQTESKIMQEIYEVSEDKTLIIIAHRHTTLSHCDKIYRVENGKMTEI